LANVEMGCTVCEYNIETSRRESMTMRQVASKWKKYLALKSHDGVARHLPDMRLYSPRQLEDMLGRHAFVVAKPVVGGGGSGAVKISRTGNGGYTYQYMHKKRTVGSFAQLTAALHRITRGRKYVVQQGIPLATIKGRPVDYRVKMVKQGGGWKTTAVVAKVARPGLFVTNLCRGGTQLRAMQALRSCFPAKLAKAKKDTMTGVARTCTYVLEKRYPGLRALGYDFGVDQRGNVWVFEVNTRPQ